MLLAAAWDERGMSRWRQVQEDLAARDVASLTPARLFTRGVGAVLPCLAIQAFSLRVGRAVGLPVLLMAGCRIDAPDLVTPFEERNDTVKQPAISRVELTLSGYSPQESVPSPQPSPFGLVYDPGNDRFLFPGQFSIRPGGVVELDPEPIGLDPRSDGLSKRDIYVGSGYCRRGYFNRLECAKFEVFERVHPSRGIYAIRADPATVVVLEGAIGVEDRSESFAWPFAVMIGSFDRGTYETLWGEELKMPHKGDFVARRDPSWTRRALERFARDGTLVVDVSPTARVTRRAGGRLANGRGRLVRVEISPGGQRRIVARGRWNITAAEFGLPTAAFARKLFRAPRDVEVRAARSPDGVYRLEEEYVENEDGGSSHRYTVASYDRELELRWRRRSPYMLQDWIVDDEGWMFFVIRGSLSYRPHGNDEAPLGVMAVEPNGDVAWKVWISARPPAREWGDPKGALVLAEDDLCYYAADSADGKSELICLSPRHGSG